MEESAFFFVRGRGTRRGLRCLGRIKCVLFWGAGGGGGGCAGLAPYT